MGSSIISSSDEKNVSRIASIAEIAEIAEIAGQEPGEMGVDENDPDVVSNIIIEKEMLEDLEMAGQAEDEWIALQKELIQSRSSHYWYITYFSVIGTCQLMIWNMVLNSYVAIQNYIWPGSNWSDILGGTEHAFAFVVCIISMFFPGMGFSKWTIFISTLGTLVLYLLYPIITQCLSGSENEKRGEGWLCLIIALCGLCVGGMHIYGYALAGVMPFNYCGYVSFGNGISGLYSFVIFELFSETGIFDKTVEGQQQLIWVFFAFGALTSVVQLVMGIYAFRDPILLKSIDIARRRNDDIRLKPKRSFWQIFRSCWLQCMNAGFPLFLTLCMFPGLGPYSWYLSYSWTSILNGVFQVTDMIVRFIPNLGSWTLIPKKWLIWLELLRCVIMIPLFEAAFRWPETAFLDNTWWLCFVMLIFTISNGWLISCGTIYAPETVSDPREKETVGEILAATLLANVTVGLFTGKLFVLNPPPPPTTL